MRDPVLDEALKRLAAEASTRFSSLVATGDEIPFDVAENNGESSHFYRYVPLTSRFVDNHLEELRSLPAFGPARGAVASSGVAAPFLENRGVAVPSDPERRAELMVEMFIASLWEGTTEFSLDLGRVEQALSTLEAQSRDITEADVLLAPLVGFEMTPTEIEFSNGIKIVRGDSVTAPLEATSSEGTDRNAWQPAYLAVAPLGDTADAPRHAVERLTAMVEALRLFKDGSVGLGPFAFAPVDSDSWRRIETNASPPRAGSYFLIESEVERLDEFVQLMVERSAAADVVSFAQQRFQYGCERDRPIDALSDHILAWRSALAADGVIDAPLPARAAALITGEADDERVRERMENAFALESLLLRGEDVTIIGDESASYLAAWLEDATRQMLREAILGHFGENLSVAAEETLLNSGLMAGEGSLSDMGNATEWDRVEEPSAEIHIFKPKVDGHQISQLGSEPHDSFGPEVEAGVDPLFGSVPEFEPDPDMGPRIESMPEVEAALGINRDELDRDYGDSGVTQLFEPVPEEGEIKVSATTEIGSTFSDRSDWLSQESHGETLSWPSSALGGHHSHDDSSEHPPRNKKFFPAPETTEWSVSEMNYKRKRAQ